MQYLSLTLIVLGSRLGREHHTQRVDDVLASLVTSPTLAEDAGDLGNRDHDPPILTRLVDDRQIKLLRHKGHDTP